MALVTMRPHRLRYRLTAAAALLSFVSCLTITSSEVAAQDDSDESACRKVLGHDSACCDKLEWLLEFPNASTSDCLPGGGTVLECMVLATAKSLPYDVGLYNMCQNTVSVNVSGTYFLVRTRRQSARNAREACHDVSKARLVCSSERFHKRRHPHCASFFKRRCRTRTMLAARPQSSGSVCPTGVLRATSLCC